MSSPVPTPVHDVANVVGVGIGIATTVLTAALGSGLVPNAIAAKGGALVNLLKLLPPVVAGVMVLVAAKSVAVQATPLVSPAGGVTLPSGGLVGRLLHGILG